jgi:hypothetical protein
METNKGKKLKERWQSWGLNARDVHNEMKDRLSIESIRKVGIFPFPEDTLRDVETAVERARLKKLSKLAVG